MSLLARAPAFAVLCGWIGALSAVRLGVSPIAAAAAGGLCTAAVLLWGEGAFPAPGSLPPAVLILLVSFLGSWWVAARLVQPPELPRRLDETGRVLLERSWGSSRVALMGFPSGRFLVALPWGTGAMEGQMYRVRGGPRPFRSSDSLRGFDEEAYWRCRGAQGVLDAALLEFRSPPSGWVAWRNGVRSALLLNLPSPVRGYLLAAWLGRRDPDLANQHARWGTSHILAVSGFHVALVVGILHLLLRRVPGRLLWESLFLWGYVLLAGAAASALRAGAMIQVVLLGGALGRPSRAFHSLCVAALLLLALNPWLFTDLGFRLSVLSVLVLSSWSGLPRPFLPLAGPLVWLVTAPLVTWAFGTVPVAGLAVNLLALPFFALFFPLVSLLSLPALAGLPGSALLAFPGELLAEAFALVADGICWILPWQVPFSPLLASLAAGAAAFGALRASSCSVPRAILAALGLAGGVLAWSVRVLAGV